MTGTIELDQDGHHLVIRFEYDEFLVQEVRNLPGRRWDKRQRCWRVPAEHAEVVASAFMKHGFELAPEVTAILAGTADIAPKPKSEPKRRAEADPEAGAGADAEAPSGPLTVSQLNERARAALQLAFPTTVQVVGEIVEFDKNKDRRHVFFRLVEKAAVGERMTAVVDAAMFERTVQRVLPRLERAGLELRDGLEILVEARIDLYPATGRFQLIVEDIKPEFTLGKLALGREQILARLRAAGVHDRNAELPLPVPATRIGVLTSPDSDGWNDFRHELETSGIGFQVTLVPIRVQGEQLEPTLLAGLAWFAARASDFDVLCIVRGGGAKTDLAWFDNEAVAFAVAGHPLKILCGIGHERDRSVLDEITTSLKTPTAVAAFLVESWQAVDRALGDACRRLVALGTRAVETGRRALTDAARALSRAVGARVADERQRLRLATPRLVRASTARLGDERRRLVDAAGRARLATLGRLRTERRDLDHAANRLQERSAHRLQRAAARLDLASARQRLLDPRRVLERGYALVRTADDGRIVTDAARLRPGGAAEIQFRDGRAAIRIDAVRLDPAPAEHPTPDPND